MYSFNSIDSGLKNSSSMKALIEVNQAMKAAIDQLPCELK